MVYLQCKYEIECCRRLKGYGDFRQIPSRSTSWGTGPGPTNLMGCDLVWTLATEALGEVTYFLA
jgi:hypothetical protein